MMIDLNLFQLKAKQQLKENSQFINRLKQNKKIDLDPVVHQLHHEAFSRFNCLECANCCLTLGPRLSNRDIERLAKYLNMKQTLFIQKYIRVDEDSDYIFQTMPCPFLGTDNYCRVYDQRPKACSEYPHTDRRRFAQILDLTLKNSLICPVVLEIVNELKNKTIKRK